MCITENSERVIICPAGLEKHATQVHPDLAVLSKGPLEIKVWKKREIIEIENEGKIHKFIYLRSGMELWNKPLKCRDCPIEDKRCQITFPPA